MEDPRRATNRESAQRSRDEKRQRLGEDEFKRQNAATEKARRQKNKEQQEIAAVTAEIEVEQQQQQLAAQAQAQQQAQAQHEQLAVAVAAEQQKLQALQQQAVEARAELDAISSAAAAAAAAVPPPPPPPPPAQPPAAPPAKSAPALKPLPTDLTPLSNALGVSSAPNLGAGDILRLAKVLDTCGDMVLVDGALRRLQVVKLSQPRRSSA